MLRLRSASFALASGLLITLSGCASQNQCGEGGTMSRFFSGDWLRRPSSRAVVESADCECRNSYMPAPAGDFGMMPGPSLVPPTMMQAPTPIPITNTQSPQAPTIFKMPQASPTPYAPTVH